MRGRRPRARKVVATILLSAATALLVSCGSAGPSAPQTTFPPSTIAPASTSTAITMAPTTSTVAPTSATDGSATSISAEDAKAVHDLAFAFWEAYNAYDADKAVTYLDESYRPVKEKIIRDEISRIETFGVKLGMSEKTAPTLIGPDEAEMYLNMKEPTGTRTLWMKFARHGDSWTITYSEQTK